MRISDWSSDVCSSDLYLLLQVYILRDDDLGRDLKARLTRRARDGLRIYMLYDEIGSYGLPHLFIAELRAAGVVVRRSEEHTSELQSLMRISYAVFCLKKKKTQVYKTTLPCLQMATTTETSQVQ